MELTTMYNSFECDAKIVVGMIDLIKYGALMDTIVKYASSRLHITPPIMMYNKQMNQQRDVGFFSDESEGYYYSRTMSASIPLNPQMVELLVFVNSTFGTQYNGILINRYNDGKNYISAHSDAGIDKCGVLSLSYGVARKFRIRKKVDKKIICDVSLPHGSILQMSGADFQKHYTHEVPVQKKVKDCRYSFTFRKHSK